jgi:hypothetical protein
MPIKIKNREWIEFKETILRMLHEISQEQDKIEIPDSEENFSLLVNDCEVHPVFLKRQEFLKLEYDFSLCSTKIRLLSIYLYNKVLRIDFSLKEEIPKDTEKTWQENQS